MSLKRLALPILVAVLASCTWPEARVSVHRASVTLHFAPPSRTVGVDWSTLVKTYEVTLTKVPDGTTVSGATAVGETSLTLSGISVGSWDITVWGKDASNNPVAKATLTNQSLPSGTAIAVKVLPLTTGTGGFAFKLRFPQPADVADQIDEVTGQLYTLAGTPFGSSFGFTRDQFTEEAGLQAVTFSRSGLTPDSYRLAIVLERAGGIPARYLSEALNITGGTTADRWIASNGTLASQRDLTLSDFTSTNTSLGNLVLTSTNLATLADGSAYVFDDSVSSYTLNASSVDATQALTITPTTAMPGQSLEYFTANTAYTGDTPGTWTKIAPGATHTFDLTAGGNQLWVRVTAPDGLTKGTYAVSVTKKILASSLTLSIDWGGTVVASNEAKSVSVAFGNNPTNTAVTFTSSNPTVATVDWDAGTAKYWIFGLKVGTTTITAAHEDGVSDTLDIEVVPAFAQVQSSDRGKWIREFDLPLETVAVAGNATSRYALTDSGTLFRFQDGIGLPLMTVPETFDYLAAAPDGTFYAGDPSTDRVYRYDGVWEPLPGTLANLGGLAVDRGGQVYVADDGKLKARTQGLWTALGSLPPGFQALGGGDGITAIDSTLTAAGTLWAWDVSRWVAQAAAPAGAVATGWAQGQKILRKF